MGKTMTLRGSIDNVEFGNASEKLILSYESPDRSRGWKITGAFVWAKNNTGGAYADGTRDANYGAFFRLQTDSISNLQATDFLSADESRVVAWANVSYNNLMNAAGAASGQMSVHGDFTRNSEFLIDVDRIVTNELYIAGVSYISSLSDNPPPQDYSYMIVMEEIKIKPTESVLQQLKGIGQDIDN